MRRCCPKAVLRQSLGQIQVNIYCQTYSIGFLKTRQIFRKPESIQSLNLYISYSSPHIDNWPVETRSPCFPFLPLAGLMLPIECCLSHSSQDCDAGSTGTMSGLVSVGQPNGELETYISSANSVCRSANFVPLSTSLASCVKKSPSSSGTMAPPTSSPNRSCAAFIFRPIIERAFASIHDK
jgi:hypothetical protein